MTGVSAQCQNTFEPESIVTLLLSKGAGKGRVFTEFEALLDVLSREIKRGIEIRSRPNYEVHLIYGFESYLDQKRFEKDLALILKNAIKTTERLHDRSGATIFVFDGSREVARIGHQLISKLKEEGAKRVFVVDMIASKPLPLLQRRPKLYQGSLFDQTNLIYVSDPANPSTGEVERPYKLAPTVEFVLNGQKLLGEKLGEKAREDRLRKNAYVHVFEGGPRVLQNALDLYIGNRTLDYWQALRLFLYAGYLDGSQNTGFKASTNMIQLTAKGGPLRYFYTGNRGKMPWLYPTGPDGLPEKTFSLTEMPEGSTDGLSGSVRQRILESHSPDEFAPNSTLTAIDFADKAARNRNFRTTQRVLPKVAQLALGASLQRLYDRMEHLVRRTTQALKGKDLSSLGILDFKAIADESRLEILALMNAYKANHQILTGNVSDHFPLEPWLDHNMKLVEQLQGFGFRLPSSPLRPCFELAAAPF